MGKRVREVIIGLLLLVGIALALIAFTPLGVPLRYEAQAPTDMAAFEAIRASERTCFGLGVGGGVSGGSTTNFAHEQRYEWASHYSGPIFESEEKDCRGRLLEALKRLDKLATDQGFALLPGGVEYASFGPEGGPDTEFSAPFSIHGLDGNSHSTGNAIRFRPDERFCLVSLTYAARRNLACHFRWTLILDSQTGGLELLAQYFGQSPVFAGPRTSSLDKIEFTVPE